MIPKWRNYVFTRQPWAMSFIKMAYDEVILLTARECR